VRREHKETAFKQAVFLWFRALDAVVGDALYLR
jgi:hypothetical protein